MFFIASKILDGLTSPTVWIVACLLAGWWLHNQKWRKRFLITGLILLVFFTNPFIINQVLQEWELPSKNEAVITQPYDVAIVLGGCMRYYNHQTDRIVYGSAVDRLMQAIALYHGKKIKKILLSGGSGYVMHEDWKEAVWLAQVLYKCGIPKEDVILENNSRNTRENAQYSTAILKNGKYGNRFLLITSASHMRRSIRCFNKTGLAVSPYPVDERSGKGIDSLDKVFLPDAANIESWDVLIHEWIGIVTYWVAGYI